MARFILTAQIQMRPPTASELNAVGAAIRNGLNGINIDINMRVPVAQQRVLSQVSNALRQTKKEAQETTNAFEAMGKSLSQNIRKYGSFTIATGAFIRLGIAIRQSISEAIAFETEIRKIAQGQQKAISYYSELKNEITSLSTSLGVSSLDLATNARVLAQAGLSAGEVKVALEGLAKSTLAPTFGEMAQTNEALIAIFRQFNLTAYQTKEILGSINKVSADFAVESEDIAAAIRLAGASFAAASTQADQGITSFRQFISLFTSVRQTTRGSPESIATGLRTIVTRLQRSGTIEYFKSLGIELADTNGQFIGAYHAIKKLAEATENLQGTDPQFAAITELLGGYRQMDKTIPLLRQFVVTQRAYNSAVEGQKSLDEGLALAMETLSQKLAKVRNQFDALIRKLTESESFKTIANTFLTLASALIRVADSLTSLLPIFALIFGAKIGGAIPSIARGFAQDYRKVVGRSEGGLVRYSGGGIVPGSGNTDSVPVNLEKGQYVLRKKAVEALQANSLVMPGEMILTKSQTDKIGVGTLDKINHIDKYAQGGPVGGKSKGFGSFSTEALEKQVDKLFDKMLANMGSELGDILAQEFEAANQELSSRKAEIRKSVIATSKTTTPFIESQQYHQERLDEVIARRNAVKSNKPIYQQKRELPNNPVAKIVDKTNHPYLSYGDSIPVDRPENPFDVADRKRGRSVNNEPLVQLPVKQNLAQARIFNDPHEKSVRHDLSKASVKNLQQIQELFSTSNKPGFSKTRGLIQEEVDKRRQASQGIIGSIRERAAERASRVLHVWVDGGQIRVHDSAGGRGPDGFDLNKLIGNKNTTNTTNNPAVNPIASNLKKSTETSALNFFLLSSIVGQTASIYAEKMNPTLGKLVGEFTTFISGVQGARLLFNELKGIDLKGFIGSIKKGGIKNAIPNDIKSFLPLFLGGSTEKFGAGTRRAVRNLFGVSQGKSILGHLGKAKSLAGPAAILGAAGYAANSVGIEGLEKEAAQGKQFSTQNKALAVGGAATEGVALGALIGQLAIPIPILGAALGALTGAAIGAAKSLSEISLIRGKNLDLQYKGKFEEELSGKDKGGIGAGYLKNLAQPREISSSTTAIGQNYDYVTDFLFRSGADRKAGTDASWGDRFKRIAANTSLGVNTVTDYFGLTDSSKWGQNQEDRRREYLAEQGYDKEKAKSVLEKISSGDSNYASILKDKKVRADLNLALGGTATKEANEIKVAEQRHKEYTETIGKQKKEMENLNKTLNAQSGLMARFAKYIDNIGTQIDALDAKNTLIDSSIEQVRSGKVQGIDFTKFYELASKGKEFETPQYNNSLDSSPNKLLSNAVRIETAANQAAEKILLERSQTASTDSLRAGNRYKLSTKFRQSLESQFGAQPNGNVIINNQVAKFEKLLGEKLHAGEDAQADNNVELKNAFDIVKIGEEFAAGNKTATEAQIKFANAVSAASARVVDLTGQLTTLQLEGINKRSQNKSQYNDSISKIADLRDKNFDFIGTSGRARFSQLAEIGKVGNIGTPTGNTGADVSSLIGAQTSFEGQISALRAKSLNGQTLSQEETGQWAMLDSQLKAVNASLEVFATNTEYVAALERKAGDLKQQREAAKGTAIDYLTGDAANRRKQTKALAFASQLGSGGINNIQQLQGNREGIELFKQIRGEKEFNQAISKIPGLDKLSNPSAQENAIHAALEQEAKARLAASDALSINKQLMLEFNTAIKEAAIGLDKLHKEQKLPELNGPNGQANNNVVTHQVQFAPQEVVLRMPGLDSISNSLRPFVEDLIRNSVNTWWKQQSQGQNLVPMGPEHHVK